MGILRFGIILLLFSSAIFSQFQFPPSSEQGVVEEIKRYNVTVEQLYSQGKYQEALPIAEKAVQIAKNRLGLEHPQHKQSLQELPFSKTSKKLQELSPEKTPQGLEKLPLEKIPEKETSPKTSHKAKTGTKHTEEALVPSENSAFKTWIGILFYMACVCALVGYFLYRNQKTSHQVTRRYKTLSKMNKIQKTLKPKTFR